jgi:hypothetical protein
MDEDRQARKRSINALALDFYANWDGIFKRVEHLLKATSNQSYTHALASQRHRNTNADLASV